MNGREAGENEYVKIWCEHHTTFLILLNGGGEKEKKIQYL
jgi:hypothetical protein